MEKSAHEEALSWFSDNAGKQISWPKPVRGIFLANKAKGIHKPAGLPYALSIRQMLSSGYNNSTRILPDGSWEISYAQEGEDTNIYTNRGLMACLDDNVPIGVLQQVIVGEASYYNVLGLGRIVEFKNNQFLIRQIAWNNFETILTVATSEGHFVAQNDLDARARLMREITMRQGQPGFKKALLAAYGRKCAISGSKVVQTLEAAHIVPYRGIHSHHVQNGILMRSDIHVLFDLGLIHIHPRNFEIEIEDFRGRQEYMQYHGKFLRLPKVADEWPSRQALCLHLKQVGFSTL